MGLHGNARLGLAGRRQLVADVEAGCSCREAARRYGVSPTTACKWWHRWRLADARERRSLACLYDRSSRPLRSPRLLPPAEQARICAARRRSGWTEADRRRDGPRARDRLADASPRRDLTAAQAAARRWSPLRVALSR